MNGYASNNPPLIGAARLARISARVSNGTHGIGPAENAFLVGAENDISLSNRAPQNSGDSLFLPFSQTPHPLGLQIFDKEAAEIMEFGFKQGGQSLPIWIGHPDVPRHPTWNPAAKPVGEIKGFATQATGALLTVAYNDRGNGAIRAKEVRSYSPFWKLRRVNGGLQPVKLVSVGLTNAPRMQNLPALVAANSRLSPSAITYQEIVAECAAKCGISGRPLSLAEYDAIHTKASAKYRALRK